MIRCAFTAFACAAALIATPARSEPLADILARMDRTARDFKSMSAKMKQVEYTAVIDESSEKHGEVWLKRGKGGSVARFDFERPEQSVVHIDSHEVRIYLPNAKTVQIYDVQKYTRSINVDQLLLMGFGTSGAELKKSYTVTDGGGATVGTAHATRIELIPKSKDLREYVTKIELWVPDGQSNAVQEKVTQPSMNYKLVTYSDLNLNRPLPDSVFELKLPPGTRSIYPQK